MKTLSLVGLMIALSATAYGAEKNLCDQLIAEGASAATVQKCHEEIGYSEYYLERQEQLLQDAQERSEAETRAEEQRSAEEERLRRLKEAITEKHFTYLDLKEKGFGLPYVAKQVTYKYDGSGYVTGADEEMITTGTEMCKFLGFEKAKKVVINKKGVSARDAKGKSLHIKTSNPLFGSKKYERQVYSSDQKGRKVYYFQSVTCVRSRIADNELMEHINQVTSYLEADLQTGAPIAQTDTRVNDSGRNSGSHSNRDDDYNDDSSEFTYSRGSGQ
jgi:hypothetical protein